ncbi:MAG TPA: hypothetical protein DFS52_06400, partial [Myxococcales bacterium]|nr:hypothetical protein [Myxococcales bacterium]
MLAKGADPKVKAKDGSTALLHAVNGENFEIAKLLIAKGADLNAQDSKGNCPLLRASQGCAVDEMEMTGQRSQRPGHSKRCPKEMKALVKLLLDKGADPNAKSADG